MSDGIQIFIDQDGQATLSKTGSIDEAMFDQLEELLAPDGDASRIAQMKSKIARLSKDNEALRGFANEAYAEWLENECYEGDLAHTARKYGLLDEIMVPTPLLTGEVEDE